MPVAAAVLLRSQDNSSTLHCADMSNELLDASKSDRTNKPLVVKCDYNTKCQDLTFDSAQNCSCNELRAKVLTPPFPVIPFVLKKHSSGQGMFQAHFTASLQNAVG